VRDAGHRTAVSYAYWTLCALELDRGDYCAAGQAVGEYLRIEPNGFEEALESARFLCRCVRLSLADGSLGRAESESVARSYRDRAMEALLAAVRCGFRDANDLKKSRAYESLRGRDDFERLVREVEALASAAGQDD
jgi:hypothetical protein